MKKMKKLASIALALVMTLALALPAFAQTVGEESEETPATITITNASKGVTYKVYKVFGATVDKTQLDDNGKGIAYTFAGDLPAPLNTVFEKVPGTDYVVKKAGATDETILTAVKTYATSTTPINGADGTKNTDGGEMKFYVPYGYYVIKSDLSTTAQLTVDSTAPNASVVDKSSSDTPHFPDDPQGNDVGKTSDKDTVKIGDTVTYTVTFITANWVGEGANAKQVKSYTIEDTLPEFLSDVSVTSVKIKQAREADVTLSKTFENKKMEIEWVDSITGKSIYNNGAVIEIVYTARVNGTANVGTANTNTVKASWTFVGENTPGTPVEDHKDIFTYSFELVKHNSENRPLSGASFSLYASETAADAIPLVKVSENVYRLAKTEGTENVDAEDTRVTVVTTPADGKITIQGLATGSYWLAETAAPEGYNKLTTRQEVVIANTNKTTTFDEATSTWSGDHVLNNTGAELPSTGGIGTTIFTVVGGLLMVGAAVLFITKKRSAT